MKPLACGHRPTLHPMRPCHSTCVYRPLLAAALLWLAGMAANAQQVPGAAAQPQPQAPAAAAVVPKASSWQRLSAEQKRALAPLAQGWDSFTPTHQRKWREISKNYASLPAAEQSKMHARMAEWAALSPQERAQARLNFGITTEIARELTPAEKLAKWQAYQALPPEERNKLAEGGRTRPLGAAPAVKPVPPQKLAVVPAAPVKPAAKPAEAPAADTAAVPAETPASN